MKHKINLWLAFLCCLAITQAQEIITPAKAISLALAHNYDILLEDNNVSVAKNNGSLLNSTYLPSVSINGGANYKIDNTEAVFSNGTTTNLTNAESSNYNASVNVNYLLFDGFGRKYTYKSLKEQYQLSELQARETIENTVIQLFSIYYDVSQIKENVISLKESLKISKERLKRVSYQFEYGQTTKLGVLNAEVDINNDSIQLLNTLQQLKSAKRNLNTLLGDTLDDYDIESTVFFDIQLDEKTLLKSAKKKNVALLKSEKNIALKELDIKLIDSEFLPKLSLNGGYGWNKNNNNSASFLETSTNNGLSAGLSLTWNLFNGSAFVQAKNRKLNLQNEKLKQKSLLNQIERDFNNAWDDYQNKYAVYQIREASINTAQNNFNRTLEKFKLGQVSSIEFRQAQLNLTSTEISKNQAKFQAKYAELQVLYLSGDLLNKEF